MENLSHISTIRELLNRHGFSFSKTLGQNFLINPSICPRMAELGGADGEVGVLEIGPGIGVLTVELARRAKKVVSIEIDSRLLPVLEETLGDFENVRVIHGDAMKLDLHAILQDHLPDMDVVICANLPYYITSPIIMRLLEERLPVRAITVMVQREAAVRLCAEPGTRDIGAVSIALRYYCTPKTLFQVSRGSFMPAPDVDSTVIRLDVLDSPPITVQDEKLFFQVVRACFSKRRKTVANCLSSAFPLSKADINACIESVGLSPTVRAEQLTMEGFQDLTEGLYQHLTNGGVDCNEMG